MKIVENNVLRILMLTMGTIFFGLGILGLILPVLPGGIFLIVSAACFLRSSEKFYYGLLHHKFLGKFVKDYAEKGVISSRLKIIVAIALILPIVSSIILYSLKLP